MRTLFRLITALALTFGCADAAFAGEAPLHITGATTVNADRLIHLVQSNSDLVIIDNRTIADYEAGHIEGALHLLDTDMTEEVVLARLVKSKNAPVLFYC